MALLFDRAPDVEAHELSLQMTEDINTAAKDLYHLRHLLMSDTLVKNKHPSNRCIHLVGRVGELRCTVENCIGAFWCCTTSDTCHAMSMYCQSPEVSLSECARLHFSGKILDMIELSLNPAISVDDMLEHPELLWIPEYVSTRSDLKLSHFEHPCAEHLFDIGTVVMNERLSLGLIEKISQIKKRDSSDNRWYINMYALVLRRDIHSSSLEQYPALPWDTASIDVSSLRQLYWTEEKIVTCHRGCEAIRFFLPDGNTVMAPTACLTPLRTRCCYLPISWDCPCIPRPTFDDLDWADEDIEWWNNDDHIANEAFEVDDDLRRILLARAAFLDEIDNNRMAFNRAEFDYDDQDDPDDENRRFDFDTGDVDW